MSNPPPVRPWFRLASIRSVPAPAPATEGRPSLTLPTFRTASAPPSPQTRPTQPEPTAVPAVMAPQFADRSSAPASPAGKVAAPPSASLPTSPVQKAAITTSSTVSSPPSRKPTQPPFTSSPDKIATTARVTSPTQSSKTIKPAIHSPMQSPKITPTAPPPSPLTLPPSQLKTQTEPKIPVEAEPKTVLVQKTIDKPKQWLNGNGESHKEPGETRNHGNSHHGKHLTAKEGEIKEKGIHRKLSDYDDSGMRVITIAGENRGAYMELVQSQKKHDFGGNPNHLHQKGNSKTKDDGGESVSSSSDGEGSAKRKDKNQKGRTASSLPLAAYMNSNVQCVNNSLLYHTSCSHHDPGVRLSLSKKPFGEGYHLKEHVDGQQQT